MIRVPPCHRGLRKAGPLRVFLLSPSRVRTTAAGPQVDWALMESWVFSCLEDDDDDEPEDDDQEIGDKTLPRWQIWLALERARDQRHWRPWRPDKTKKQTEDDCEDPERQASTPLGGVPAVQPPPAPDAHWGSGAQKKVGGLSEHLPGVGGAGLAPACGNVPLTENRGGISLAAGDVGA